MFYHRLIDDSFLNELKLKLNEFQSLEMRIDMAIGATRTRKIRRCCRVYILTLFFRSFSAKVTELRI